MRRALSLLLAVFTLSCTPDTTAPVRQIEPNRLFWALTLDHHAVTLSVVPPYDTFRITAVARTSTGAVLPDAATPRYTSTDVDRVQVDSTGLLRAIKAGTRVVVVAIDTIDAIVHADTVWVNVTNASPAPVLTTLSIHPIPPDSAKTALSGGSPLVDQLVGVFPVTLSARATDADGQPINGLIVHYVSLDPSTATIDPLMGTITGLRVGEVTLVATATAYGVTKADTLPFTIGLPLGLFVQPEVRVDAHGDTIVAFPTAPTLLAAGGDVMWFNTTGLPVDVTFDDPTDVRQDDGMCAMGEGTPYVDVVCGEGNIALWYPGPPGDDVLLGARLRRFPVPGTYHYRSTRYGTTGTVIVQ